MKDRGECQFTAALVAARLAGPERYAEVRDKLLLAAENLGRLEREEPESAFLHLLPVSEDQDVQALYVALRLDGVPHERLAAEVLA